MREKQTKDSLGANEACKGGQSVCLLGLGCETQIVARDVTRVLA